MGEGLPTKTTKNEPPRFHNKSSNLKKITNYKHTIIHEQFKIIMKLLIYIMLFCECPVCVSMDYKIYSYQEKVELSKEEIAGHSYFTDQRTLQFWVKF